MKTIESLIWLLPVLFLLHDMEEIILVEQWKRNESKRRKYLNTKFIVFGSVTNTAGAATCVYEEFIIVCIITLIGLLTGHYGLWFGMAVANTAHLLFLHLVLCTLQYRSYVPGQVTAWLTIGPSIWLLIAAQHILHYSILEMIAYSILGISIAMINLHFLHKNAWKISKLLLGSNSSNIDIF